MHGKGLLLPWEAINFFRLAVKLPNEECRVGFESQNQSFIQRAQPPDGSISEITAGVAESALLDNKIPR